MFGSIALRWKDRLLRPRANCPMEGVKTKAQERKCFLLSQSLKRLEMARYDLPTYVLRVLGYFWKTWNFGVTYPECRTKSQITPEDDNKPQC